jgi:hypothetical protein
MAPAIEFVPAVPDDACEPAADELVAVAPAAPLALAPAVAVVELAVLPALGTVVLIVPDAIPESLLPQPNASQTNAPKTPHACRFITSTFTSHP